MKKSILAIAVIAASIAAMTSCSKNSSCYEVTTTYKQKAYSATAISGVSSPEGVEHEYEAVSYAWNTPQGIKETIDQAKKDGVKEGAYNIKITKKKNSYDYKACVEAVGSYKIDGNED